MTVICGGDRYPGAESDNPVCVRLYISLAPQWFSGSCLYLEFMSAFGLSTHEMNLKVII
jgi:hypothetical protein